MRFMNKKLKKIVIIDNAEDRKENIKAAVSCFAGEVEPYAQINGEDSIQDNYDFSNGNKVCVQNTDLLFIHRGNTFAEDYIRAVIKNNAQLVIIVYTGGDSISICDDIFNNKSVVCKSKVLGENAANALNIIPALKNYTSNNNVQEFFNIILNFNPEHEEKLKFLQDCLTEIPKVLPESLSSYSKLFENLLKDLKKIDSNTLEYDNKLHEFANTLLKQ